LGSTANIPLDVEIVDENMYRVSLTIDGITAVAYVSSMHLVEDKRKQLLNSIRREAARAFN